MRGRPLCVVCLVFLSVTGLLVKAGVISGLVRVPESTLNVLAAGDVCTIKGTAYRIEKKETNQIIYLKQVQLQGSLEDERQIMLPVKACIMYDKSFTEIPIGAKITGKGNIKLFEGARNPGNFEQDFYYEKQGIVCAVFAENITEVKTVNTAYAKIYTWLMQVKAGWNQILTEKAGKETGGILAAILTGEKADLAPEIKELYQKNGIGHILAISGLHVSFIGLGIYQFLRKLGCSFLSAGFISTMILVLYMLMVGSSVSVIRAVLMLSLRIGADITGRTYDLITSLLTAAAVTVIWRPLYLKDASFLLSYGAILGILIMTPVFRVIYRGSGRFMTAFLGGFGLQLFLLPVMLYFYYEFPPYSILLNLIVIPLLTFVMGGAIAGSALQFVGELAGMLPGIGAVFESVLEAGSSFCLLGCKIILKLYQVLGELCMGLPGARIVCGRPEMWQILVYYGIVLGLSLTARRIERRCLEAGDGNVSYEEQIKYRAERHYAMKLSALLAAAVFICGTNFRNFRKTLEVTMVDVGQGECIYIRTPSGRHILVDGGSTDQKQVGKYRIEPFFLSRGVKRLDYVLVTHGDSDHCSGIEEMLARQEFGIEIERLLLPAVWKKHDGLNHLAEEAAGEKILTGRILPKQYIEDGECRLMCLQPGTGHEDWESNEASLILLLTYGEFSMLLTGDVEGKGEKYLCDSGELPKITVLKTAHHGSEHSTQEELLRQTDPQIALISAGIDNSYGHPHKALLQRLREFGIPFYNTADSGALTVRTDGRKVRVETFLDIR